MAARKRKSYALDELTKLCVEAMARDGGFSHRYIAKRLGIGTSESAVNRVRYVLYQRRVLVTDWREGRSLLAQSHAGRVTRVARKKERSPRKRKHAA